MEAWFYCFYSIYLPSKWKRGREGSRHVDAYKGNLPKHLDEILTVSKPGLAALSSTHTWLMTTKNMEGKGWDEGGGISSNSVPLYSIHISIKIASHRFENNKLHWDMRYV
jgi:hypothetical protein